MKEKKKSQERNTKNGVVKGSRNVMWYWKQICELRGAKDKKSLYKALLECYHWTYHLWLEIYQILIFFCFYSDIVINK